MWLLLILVTQWPPGTPLPAAAHTAIDIYGKCVFDHFSAGMAVGEKPGSHGPAAMRNALSDGAAARARAIDGADKALATDPAYCDPANRRAAMVANLDGFEAIMRETATGGTDPDKW